MHHDAGIVERPIEPAEGLDRKIDHCLDFGLARHIDAHGAGNSLLVTDQLFCFPGTWFGDVGDDDLCARLGKDSTGCLPDSRPRAGYDDDLVVEHGSGVLFEYQENDEFGLMS